MSQYFCLCAFATPAVWSWSLSVGSGGFLLVLVGGRWCACPALWSVPLSETYDQWKLSHGCEVTKMHVLLVVLKVIVIPLSRLKLNCGELVLSVYSGFVLYVILFDFVVSDVMLYVTWIYDGR